MCIFIATTVRLALLGGTECISEPGNMTNKAGLGVMENPSPNTIGAQPSSASR